MYPAFGCERMTPELLTRMSRWLAHLEPEFFRFTIGQTLLAKSNDESPQIIWNGGSIDQDRLFGACARAAIARGWYPAIQATATRQFRASIVHYRPTFDSSEFRHSNMGLAMAVTLLQAHGVDDWETRAFPEETT